MLLRLAIRNVFRNTRRSLLTAGMVTLGSALLCVSIAWLNGVFEQVLEMATSSAGHVRIVHPEYAQLEKMMPLYANLEDAHLLSIPIQALESVEAAYPRTAVGVLITNTDEIGDHFALLNGAPIDMYEKQYMLKEQLTEGSGWFEKPGDLLLGRKVAEKMNAKLGEEIVMNGMTQDGSLSAIKGRLVGIVAGENPVQERQVFVSIEQVQYLTDMPGAATEILIFGQERRWDLRIVREMRELSTQVTDILDDPDLRPEEMEAQLGVIAQERGVSIPQLKILTSLNSLKIEPWSSREPWAGMVAMGNVISWILMVVIIFITSLGVWNTMTMSVMERTGEIGVLRAMGMKRLRVVSLFVMEALMIGLIGGLVGVLVGSMGAYYLEVVGVSIGEDVVDNMEDSVPFSRIIRADLSVFAVSLTFLTAISMAFVGSALPALRAALVQPVEAMRARR